MLFRACQGTALVLNLGGNARKLSVQSIRGFRKSAKQYCQKVEEKPIVGVPYKNLTIGVPKETFLNEKRVALSPVAVANLTKKGFNVNVEKGAGLEAKFLDSDYEASGAKMTSLQDAFQSDIVLKVRAPAESEIPHFKDNSTLISFVYPKQNTELVQKLTSKKLNVFAMDMVPRISRAQVFDALSSMANMAGYKAVIEAANNFGRFFTGKTCFKVKVCYRHTFRYNRLFLVQGEITFGELDFFSSVMVGD